MTGLIRPDGSPLGGGGGVIALPNTKPLDHTRGELIGDLGPDFVVAPMRKWADTPIIDAAVKQAIPVFRRKTTNINIPALKLDESTILIQEYHRQSRIAIVIAAWGRQMGMRSWGWLYHTTIIKLEGPLLEHLVLTGRWKTAVRH